MTSIVLFRIKYYVVNCNKKFILGIAFFSLLFTCNGNRNNQDDYLIVSELINDLDVYMVPPPPPPLDNTKFKDKKIKYLSNGGYGNWINKKDSLDYISNFQKVLSNREKLIEQKKFVLAIDSAFITPQLDFDKIKLNIREKNDWI